MREDIREMIKDEECLFDVFRNLPIVKFDDLNEVLITKYSLKDDLWLFSKFPDYNWLCEVIDHEQLIEETLCRDEALERKIDKFDIREREIINFLCDKLSKWAEKDLKKFEDKQILKEYIVKNIASFIRSVR